MDIKKLETAKRHEDGAEVNILDEHGEPTDAYITVMGVDSREWRKAMKRRETKIIEAMADKAELDEDERLDSEAEMIAAVTLDWRGFTSEDEAYLFSKERCLDFYKASPGVLAQVDRFIGNRKNFT